MGKLFGSRFFSIFLLLTSVGLTFVLLKGTQARPAPVLAGYDWAAHPNCVLIVHPMADACSSCNLSVYGWVEKAREHGLEAVVIAHKDSSELKALRRAKVSGTTILTGVAPSLIEQFSKGDRIGGVRVVNGSIRIRQIGGTPNAAFFQ